MTNTTYHLDLDKWDAVKQLHANEMNWTTLSVQEAIEELTTAGDVAELDHILRRETHFGLWLWTQGCARVQGADYQHIWVFDCLSRLGAAPTSFST